MIAVIRAVRARRAGGARPALAAHRPAARRLALCGLAVVAALLAGGCSPAPVPRATPPPSPGAVPRPVPKPTNCTQSLTEATSAQRALDQAVPGERLCIVGQYVQGASLRLASSGTPQQPIHLESDGATLTTLRITADNVVVEGFDTDGGEGIKARGANITIRNNDIRGAADDGIRCAPCTNSMIDNNMVRGADGAGILIEGQGVTAQYNDVSGSVRRAAADADGIVFFGVNLRLLHNSVHDISQRGYPAGAEPHPDCFQTFDSGPVTYGVVVQHNQCVNVDAQCLLASGAERRNTGVPAGPWAIQFLDNYCQSGADQAVYLDGYPNVVVKANTFAGRYTAGVLAVRGATSVRVVDNILIGQFEPSQVDDASRAGFDEANNQNR
jgi:Right handed beta helix region